MSAVPESAARLSPEREAEIAARRYSLRSLAAADVDIDALLAELAAVRAERDDQRAYEQRLREQHDLDVAELNRLRARVRELERPTIEKQRDEVRESYAGLIAQCREDRDYESAFDVECRLREREEQWRREDQEPVR